MEREVAVVGAAAGQGAEARDQEVRAQVAQDQEVPAQVARDQEVPAQGTLIVLYHNSTIVLYRIVNGDFPLSKSWYSSGSAAASFIIFSSIAARRPTGGGSYYRTTPRSKCKYLFSSNEWIFSPLVFFSFMNEQ